MSQKNSAIVMLDTFKVGDNYVCSKEDLQRILTNSKTKRVKKQMCSYFIWLNENRKRIEKEHFSNFYDIEDWSLETKKKYYEEKGLKVSVVKKSGRPRIASLITSMAGILWKELDINEKKKYEEISKKQKPVEEINVEIQPKEKRKRGRPKKNKEVNNVSDAIINHCNSENNDEDDEIKVEEIIFNGKTYWLDVKKFDVYDPDTEEIVGKKNGENIYIN
tara:strand:- start:23 stop:679 length:657 start_codon:yes stop_codon:yes gene_type:complete